VPVLGSLRFCSFAPSLAHLKYYITPLIKDTRLASSQRQSRKAVVRAWARGSGRPVGDRYEASFGG
jgi:hypothetical protein